MRQTRRHLLAPSDRSPGRATRPAALPGIHPLPLPRVLVARRRSPGHFPQCDAATAPFDRFPHGQTLVVGHRQQRAAGAQLGIPDCSIAFSEPGRPRVPSPPVSLPPLAGDPPSRPIHHESG